MQTVKIKKLILQGTTHLIEFQIIDQDGVGFQPTTLTMSIYDHACPPVGGVMTGSNAFVNSRDDVDVLADCDVTGQVSRLLTADDTEIGTVDACTPTAVERRVLFRWTWDSGARVDKLELILSIVPDRETVAT